MYIICMYICTYVCVHVVIIYYLNLLYAHAATGYLFVQFDKFWFAKEPENVMVFPQLRSEFVDELSWKLKQDDIKVLMQLDQ